MRMIKLGIGAILLLLTGAQEKIKWLCEHETAHYRLQARVPKEKAKELGDFMEMVFPVCINLLNIKEEPKEKFLVQLYGDRKDYVTVGKAPPQTGAHYRSSLKKLVGYHDPGMIMFALFAHEGMHQIVDFAQPQFDVAGQKATWYVEGIADCVGNFEIVNQKIYICRKNGFIAKKELRNIQSAIKASKQIPLREFFKLTKAQYYDKASLCYAQGWSLCHFFMTYPKVEESDKQIPEGKYRQFLDRFHEALVANRSLDQAYEVAFQKGNGGGKMPAIEDIEKEWKEYILSFDARGELPKKDRDAEQ